MDDSNGWTRHGGQADYDGEEVICMRKDPKPEPEGEGEGEGGGDPGE